MVLTAGQLSGLIGIKRLTDLNVGEITVNSTSVNKLFARYVLQNILGMIGMSVYILADTFFISQAEGANGIAALNLVLPLYSLIFAFGAMIGIGSAIRFSIYRARRDSQADLFFSNAVWCSVFISLIFIVPGIFIPDKILAFMGGDAKIAAIGTSYTRIFMTFTPFFMLNHVFNAFVRNDGDPSLAMAATLLSSLFNIVFDYVLMFPMKLGMAGAALATAFSPVVGIGICCFHFRRKTNTIKFQWTVPSVKHLLHSCQLGVAAFVGEISSGITTMVFNFLILGLAGNTGIAAYGIVANSALVATSVFNGVSQGSQPLFSEFYGKKEKKPVSKVLRLSVFTGLALAVLILLAVVFLAEPIVQVFNSENNAAMAAYAQTGMKLYFIGYLFAGFNIIGTGYLSATEKAVWAFAASILRGIVAIVICAVLLAKFLGMTGVWLAFPAAELITAVVIMIGIIKNT